jgi:hypothetical protein
MAQYRVMSWRGIPAQVQATDEAGRSVSQPLPPFFQQEIDRVAMAEGLVGTDDYLDAWEWSAETERPGAAGAVAQEVAEEISRAWLLEHPRRPSRGADQA